MPTKIFTTLGGKCPHNGCEFESESCKRCQWFYRAGTGTFFWCNHPIERTVQEAAKDAPGDGQQKRKRGRPPGKAAKRAVNKTKTKKR